MKREQSLSDLCRDVYAEMKREPKKQQPNAKRRSVDVYGEANKSAQFREQVQRKPASDPVVEPTQPLTTLDDDDYPEIRPTEGGGELTADAHARDRAHTQEPAAKRPKRVSARAGRP